MTDAKPKNDNMPLPDELQEAKGWNPEPGDVIKGTLVAFDVGWSDYTEAEYPIVVLDTGKGERTAIHCFQAVLRKRLILAKPNVGETISIAFHDKRPTTDGKREVAVYTVHVEGREGSGEDYWSRFGAGPANATAAASANVAPEDIAF